MEITIMEELTKQGSVATNNFGNAPAGREDQMSNFTRFVRNYMQKLVSIAKYKDFKGKELALLLTQLFRSGGHARKGGSLEHKGYKEFKDNLAREQGAGQGLSMQVNGTGETNQTVNRCGETQANRWSTSGNHMGGKQGTK